MKNYLIKFFDKEAIAVTEQEAEKIMNLIDQGNTHFRLNGEMYTCSSITRIVKEKSVGGPYLSTPTVLLSAPANPVKKETFERVKREMAAKFGWK